MNDQALKQISPSHISEEQPKRLHCWKCGEKFVPQWTDYSYDGRCWHEKDYRLPENAARRKEVQDYLEEARDDAG